MKVGLIRAKRLTMGTVSVEYKYIFSILLGFTLLWQFAVYYSPNAPSTPNLRAERMSRLLNMNNFQYLYNNEELCSPRKVLGNDKLLITLVHSARSNVDNREAIRRTWGRLESFTGWEIRLMFLIGTEAPNDQDSSRPYLNLVNSSIEMENKRYNDILMGNFHDVYRNMTYKHFMGYKWILDYCSNANFLLRIDDDMFVDIFQLIGFVTTKVTAEHDSFYCYTMRNRPPERGGESKWSVTLEEYPLSEYPDYCLGAGYLANIGVVPKLYSVLNLFKYFWIDDVLVGILAEFYNSKLSNNTSQSGIKMEDIGGKYEFYKFNKTERVWDTHQWMFTLIDKQSILDGAMERLWDRTLNSSIIKNSLTK